MLNKRQSQSVRHGLGRALVGLAIVGIGTSFLNCQGALTVLNPCGTVLAFCTAEELDALFSPIPNYNLDPTCSIPYFGLDPANAGVIGSCSPVNVYPTTPGPRPEPGF